MSNYDWHRYQLKAKKRKLKLSAEFESEIKEMKAESASFMAEYTNLTKNDENRPKKTEKTLSKWYTDRMKILPKNYDSAEPVELYHEGNKVYETDSDTHYITTEAMMNYMDKPREFQQDDRVILVYKYIPGPSYPVWGSEYECVGTIVELTTKNRRVRVEWDNGNRYEYPAVALDRVDSTVLDHRGKPAVLNPNKAFRLHKRNSMDRLKCKDSLMKRQVWRNIDRN